jgi:hypothetical protein
MVVVSAAFAFSSSRIAYELCVVMGIVVGYVSFNYEPLSTFLLVLLPTLIHVCVFTGIFIVYGALKGKSVSGVLSAVVYLVCPLISVYGLTTPSTYQVSDYYLDSTVPFEAVGLAMVRLLGLPESRESWLAFMRLMAFAYSYHYLNWFSKTRVINWHRTSRRRLSAIGILYLVSIAIYSYDFVTGYVVLLTLSLVHVVLELPLNYLSMIGVFKELRRYSGSKAQ